MVNNDLLSLVNTRPLKFWKETLALLCSVSFSTPRLSMTKVEYILHAWFLPASSPSFIFPEMAISIAILTLGL